MKARRVVQRFERYSTQKWTSDMDRKAIIASVVSVVATIVVGAILGSVFGVFERGAQALDEDAIVAVLDKELKTPAGLSHAQAISSMELSVARMEIKVEGLQSDLKEMRAALLILASE